MISLYLDHPCRLIELALQSADLLLQAGDLVILGVSLVASASRWSTKCYLSPLSRWSRHEEISDEYRPSRPTNAPLAERGSASYLAKILDLYFAENCRLRPECSSTSGSGFGGSVTEPLWWPVPPTVAPVMVIGVVPSLPSS